VASITTLWQTRSQTFLAADYADYADGRKKKNVQCAHLRNPRNLRLKATSGFALVLVLWTLVVLSTIALTLAASVGTEVRSAQESWNALHAERLAKSGHEFAAYLETRAIGTTREDLTNLPVQPVIPGFRYRAQLGAGSIELLLEGENGKLDLDFSGEEVAAGFFTAWTGNANRGAEIAASLADWRDPDDESRPVGAESAWYSGRGFRPRNARLGAADVIMVRGLTPGDFAPAVIESSDGVTVRDAVHRFTTTTPTSRRVNINYASRIVLQSIPGMTSPLLESILNGRQKSIFKSVEDLRNRTGLPEDSPALNYVAFDRGGAPGVIVIARLQDATRVQTERRMRSVIPAAIPGMSGREVLWLVERDLPLR
jgi:type II secretory pathway component PulK